MEDKTMVMKILDSKRIKYQFYKYNATSETTGVEVANILKQNYNQVFKTLVTVGKSNKNYVFVIPVDKELDLKKCASITKEKYVEMIKSKDLLNTTGYVHGGCSPIGMKKFFPTFIDETIKQFESIIFSGGKIGLQVEVKLEDLSKVIKFSYNNLIKKEE